MALFTHSGSLLLHQSLPIDCKGPILGNVGNASCTSVQSGGRCALRSCESFSPWSLPFSFSRVDGKRLPCVARECPADEMKGLEDKGVEEGVSKRSWDVSSSCVTPVFRSAPIKSPSSEEGNDGKLQVLFLSEGNVCRSVYAEAIFADHLRQHNLEGLVKCSSKAVRDYNEGESPDPRVVLVAEECGLRLPEDKVSVVFDCASDIVNADLVLVFDKFNASDALKEVTIYETVDKTSRHAGKVRRLGEFCTKELIEDIEDPFYGNMGGPEELELMYEVLDQIRDSCEGLLQHILHIKANLQGSETLKEGMKRSIRQMGALNWLVPPMLSRA